MKKLFVIMVAFTAFIAVSCGNVETKSVSNDSTAVDTVAVDTTVVDSNVVK